MGNNNRTNNLIKWVVVLFDFVLLNVIIALFVAYSPIMASWRLDRIEVFWLVCNLAMVASEWRYTTVIHLRKVSAADVLRRITEMTIMQTVLSYLLLKVVDLRLPVGKSLLGIGTTLFVLLVIARLLERMIVKRKIEIGRASCRERV